MSEVWIQIEHPNLKDSLHTVTLDSFTNLHKSKGWEVVEKSGQEAESVSGETSNRTLSDVEKVEAPKRGSKVRGKKAVSSDD